MKLQKFRWSKVYESQEEELAALLESKNIQAKITDLSEFENFELTTDADVTFWCAEGSFKLTVADQIITMQPGDALPLSANSQVRFEAGMSGCTFYETDTAKSAI